MNQILKYDFQGLKKIISGGQIGADRGALEAAKTAGIQTGGTAPRGWRTEFGPAPDLADFGLVEHYSPEYRYRTEKNAAESDGTLIIASDLQSPGTSLTIAICKKISKPFFVLKLPYKEADIPTIVNFIKGFQIETLNVAGNRDMKGSKKHHDAAIEVVTKMLNALAE